MTVRKNPAAEVGRDPLLELGELRAAMWRIVNDPDARNGDKVSAGKLLKDISTAMQEAIGEPQGATVQKLEALRLKAVQGGKK